MAVRIGARIRRIKGPARVHAATHDRPKRERTAADQKEIDTLKAERLTIVAQMTPSLVSNYERIRKGRAGVGITEVVAGRCGRCNIQLRPQFFQDLKKGETIMTCESCGRILWYNPPKHPEDLGTGTRVNMSGPAIF